MRVLILSLFTTLFVFSATTPAVAQLNDNSYRSSKNPMYWQNRKPNAAYWQQDVHYAISATIDEIGNKIDGNEAMEYWNNSPDTLHYLYFHLYQNAFVKGSHLRSLEEANGVKPYLGKKEASGLGLQLDNLMVNGARPEVEIDNTIMKVKLVKPLLPGGKLEISIQFQTYYDRGGTRRRMQMYPAWGFMHYNGVQWFPKICVYDNKFGWDTHQHLNKEFYGEFGSYDVSLDFPANYVVEATGVLENKEEVLPDTLMAKLDIHNFADKKWNESPSVITPYNKDKRKTWKYHADNVHDFAFTADPSYRIGKTTWNGIDCIAIAQEPHAAGWQHAAEYVAKVIQTFSTDIGMYQYPKMVAADANDGMEYPMLTMDGGREPGFHGLLVHEIGHNWFYGMVGNNETYRAALDEGFTQFLTAWGLKRIDGEPNKNNKGSLKNRYTPVTSLTDRNVLNAYTYDALNRTELPLNTHSDDFNNALNHDGGYRQVYYKTASMLYNLQYTLGDSLFLAAMQHYFAQWRFAHPYFEDFRNSIIQFTHVDLNWFFDEWLETTKTIDYGIGGIHRTSGKDNYTIRFKRYGEMQMPIDFTVMAKDGKQYSYTIPNTWFNKSTTNTTLQKWYGWGKLHPSYTANVNIPSGIRSVQIDTSFRLADAYMPNNYKNKGLHLRGAKFQWDAGISQPLDRRYRHVLVRPDIWWNPVDGIKAGVRMESNYMNTLHKVDATIWWNTHVLQTDEYLSTKSEGWYDRYAPVNYSVNYTSPILRSKPALQLLINSRLLDGLWYHRGGIALRVNNNNSLTVSAQTMWRQKATDKDYLLDTYEWSSSAAHTNSSLNAEWKHTYQRFKSNGTTTLSVRAPFMTGNGSDAFNYSYAQLEQIHRLRVGKLVINSRVYGRYGTGNNIPYESALWLSGSSPEEWMDNKYTRSVGFVPNDWRGISRYDLNHFQQGGGLNLRGYAGYFVADERNGEILVGYKGRSGAAANVEIDIDNYINLRPRFTKWLHADVYLFGDAGFIDLSRYSAPNIYNTQPANEISDLRVDAGLGMAFTIKQWGIFDKAKPLTLRLDMPFFINRPPYGNTQYTTVRWVVGVNRSF